MACVKYVSGELMKEKERKISEWFKAREMQSFTRSWVCSIKPNCADIDEAEMCSVDLKIVTLARTHLIIWKG